MKNHENLSLTPLKADIASYSQQKLLKDLFAALCIACISIPQALGYALIASLPPLSGIITVVLGTMIGAMFSSSSHLVIGPNNSSTLLLQATLFSYMRDIQILNSQLSFLELTAILVFFIGAIQLLFALCHLGKLIQFVSHSVTTGYILGTAVALAIGQLFPLIGITCPDHINTVYEKAAYICTHLDACNLISLSLGLFSVLLILVYPRLGYKFPSSIIVLVLASLITTGLRLTSPDLCHIETVALPPLSSCSLLDITWSLPHIDWTLINSLLPTAFAMALIGMLEANSIARSIASRTGEGLNPNQETLGLGLANLSLSFFSGMPCSGSTSRTVINISNGGATRMSALLSGSFVALFTILLCPYIEYIPTIALAAILFTTALRLIDKKQIYFCLKATKSDALVFAATLLSCIFLSLSLAFYIGIALSIILYLRKASTPHLEEFAYDDATEAFQPEKEGNIPRHPQIRIINVEGELFFGSTDLFQGSLRAFANEDTQTSAIIVRIKHAHDVDATTAIAFQQLKSYLLQHNRHLIICNVPQKVLRLLERTGLLELLGQENVIPHDPHHSKNSLKTAWKRALTLIATEEGSENPALTEYAKSQTS